MKKNSLIILICLVVLSSCVTTEYWKMKVEIPRRTELDIETFNSIIITPFLVDKEFEDFDLSQEISSFFEGMFKRKTKTTVTTKAVPLENEAQFESPDFWKNQGQGQENESKNTLFLTGTAQYSTETRKALLKRAKKRYEDPFPAEARLEQRKFFNFNMTLFLIDANSGETVFKKEYKETESYNNPNQTSFYAFFDLIQQIQEKLLRSILGLEQVQERYLVIK